MLWFDGAREHPNVLPLMGRHWSDKPWLVIGIGAMSLRQIAQLSKMPVVSSFRQLVPLEVKQAPHHGRSPDLLQGGHWTESDWLELSMGFLNQRVMASGGAADEYGASSPAK
eukprot:scaffold649662_cov52-Prasinocladus_malaysianus.AAC.1